MEVKNLSIVIVLLALIFMGGMVVLAEKSLPGDSFYGVKVSFSEKMAGFFALTKEEEVEWEERLIERRLKEVEKLILANRLNIENRSYIENILKNNIEKFTQDINEVALGKKEEVESSDLNLRLHAALNAYQAIFKKISENTNINENTKQELNILLSALGNLKRDVSKNGEKLEINISTNEKDSPTNAPAASTIKIQNSAQEILNNTKLLYQKNILKLSPSIQTEINSRLANTEKSLAEGNALVVALNYNDAQEKFQQVIKSANEIKLYILSNIISVSFEDDIGIDADDDNEDEDEDEDIKQTENEDGGFEEEDEEEYEDD
jgi:hypothetical protein